MAAAYRVHRLIQDLKGDPEEAARFRADPESFFDAYGLNDAERAALRDGSKAALIALGVHANLQMKYFRIANPPPADAPSPLASYLERLRQEA
jgi:hypothetical protein